MQSRMRRVVFDSQDLTSSFERQSTLPEVILPKIERVLGRVNRHRVPSLVQYWAVCNDPMRSSCEDGFSLTVKGHEFFHLTNHNNALISYWVNCQKMGQTFVGRKTQVGDWLAGRAVQTRVADQGTKRIDDTDLGILVLPVFFQHRDYKETVGIIELVTIKPKGSYENDLVHIHKLLMEEGLISEGMGKMIKLHYCDDIVKFPLSCSAKLQDLHMEVRTRFSKKLNGKSLISIKYEDTKGNCYQILSDDHLKDCINEAVLEETTVIRMFVELIAW